MQQGRASSRSDVPLLLSTSFCSLIFSYAFVLGLCPYSYSPCNTYAHLSNNSRRLLTLFFIQAPPTRFYMTLKCSGLHVPKPDQQLNLRTDLGRETTSMFTFAHSATPVPVFVRWCALYLQTQHRS